MSSIPTFEGNSYKGRSETSVPKIEPVVKKKPLIAKKKWSILDCFYNTSEKSFGEYFIQDLLIPNVNKMIGTVLHETVTKIFGVGSGFGPSSPYHYTNGWGWSSNPNYVNYSSVSSNPQQSNQSQKPQAGTDLSSYAMQTREDAERVLEGLEAYIEQYDVVPVSAFFSLIGVTAPYTYNDYGWNSLAEARVVSVGNGFAIHFPKPVRIR